MVVWLIALYIVGWFVFLSVMHWRRERRTLPIDPHTGQVIESGALPPPERWLVRAYLMCYSLYALLLPLTVIAALIWMSAVRAVIPLTTLDRDWHNLAFFLLMFLIWIALIVLVAGGEIYMRLGIEKHVGLRRVSLLGSTLITFAAIGLVLIWLSPAEFR